MITYPCWCPSVSLPFSTVHCRLGAVWVWKPSHRLKALAMSMIHGMIFDNIMGRKSNAPGYVKMYSLNKRSVVCYIGARVSYLNVYMLIQFTFEILEVPPLITRFMGPTWSPPGFCRPQACPMCAPWTLLSGTGLFEIPLLIFDNDI